MKREENRRCRVKATELNIFGLKAITVLNSGTILNVISANLVNMLPIVLRETKRNTKLASEYRSAVIGRYQEGAGHVRGVRYLFRFTVIQQGFMGVRKDLLDLHRYEAHFKIYRAEDVFPIALTL